MRSISLRDLICVAYLISSLHLISAFGSPREEMGDLISIQRSASKAETRCGSSLPEIQRAAAEMRSHLQRCQRPKGRDEMHRDEKRRSRISISSHLCAEISGISGDAAHLFSAEISGAASLASPPKGDGDEIQRQRSEKRCREEKR
jgi:hypothetical protein